MDTVRVGVFFDGTGNNMFTDGAQENKSTLTNVASLYQGYADGSSGDTSYSKFYVSGPGTTFGTTTSDYGTSGVTDPAVIAKDSVSLANVIDGATGASSGMRVEAALAHVRQLIAEHPGAQIVVDTFGFSRGAAEGRAFINQVNTQFPGQVTVAFAGLFDTVGGYGMPGDGGTISAEAGNNLNLSEQSAGQVVHLVSAPLILSHFIRRAKSCGAMASLILFFSVAVSGGFTRQAAMAGTPDELDPKLGVFAFARSVGTLEAHAEMCAAPPVSYESTARDARTILPDQYRKVGLDPDNIERDIAGGKSDILAMHQADPSWPRSTPSCLDFNGLVANLRCWILFAQGKKACPPPPPPETPGWQDRLRLPPR